MIKSLIFIKFLYGRKLIFNNTSVGLHFFLNTITRREREMASNFSFIIPTRRVGQCTPWVPPLGFHDLQREGELDSRVVLPRVVGCLPKQVAREPLDL